MKEKVERLFLPNDMKQWSVFSIHAIVTVDSVMDFDVHIMKKWVADISPEVYSLACLFSTPISHSTLPMNTTASKVSPEPKIH